MNQYDLREIAEHRSSHCVSLTMPIIHSGPDQQQNPVRLRTLLDRARDNLLTRGLRRPIAEKILEPAIGLIGDSLFWRETLGGLACFCSEGTYRQMRLRQPLEEDVHVSDRFRVRSLLGALHDDKRFFILTLDRREVGLYEATRETIQKIELPAIARVEVDGVDQTLQSHTHHPAQGGMVGSAAIFHGHGGPADREKEDTYQFFARGNAAVMKFLQSERAPLILACVESLVPIFRAVSSYPYLAHSFVAGSPNRMPLKELHEKAWMIAEAQLRGERQAALTRLNEAMGSSVGSSAIADTVIAADDGRIDTLFVKPGGECRGRAEPEHRKVTVTGDPKDEDLVDFAASRTLSCSGDVWVDERLPGYGGSPMAAVFRY